MCPLTKGLLLSRHMMSRCSAAPSCGFESISWWNLIYFSAIFIIPYTKYVRVWLRDGCDMRPTHTSLSGLSSKGRAYSSRTCSGGQLWKFSLTAVLKLQGLAEILANVNLELIMSLSFLCSASKESVLPYSRPLNFICSIVSLESVNAFNQLGLYIRNYYFDESDKHIGLNRVAF